MADKGTWMEIVEPLVARCEVAAAFNGQAVWNAEGAAALGKILKGMAMRLDGVIAQMEREEREKNVPPDHE